VKILIVKTSSFGDIIHAFDTLAYLKEKAPFAQIDWMVEARCASLVQAHPMVDIPRIVTPKAWLKGLWMTYREQRAFFATLPRYEIVLDLQGNCKSAWLLAHLKARLKIGFGWRSVAEWPNCFMTHWRYNPPLGCNVREEGLYLAQQYFKDTQPYQAPSVMLKISQEEQLEVEKLYPSGMLICPFTAWSNKCLSKQQLMNYLKAEEGPFYVAWGTLQEREKAEDLIKSLPGAHLLPRVSLPVLQHMMARCRKVLAMDSVALHLCGTTSTPSVSFFGPSSSQKYAPYGQQHQVIQGTCPYGQTFERRCPKLRTCQSGACIKDLKSR